MLICMDEDPSASAEYSEKQKMNGVQRVRREDRISNFPDHILHDILAFLPTKYAVRSCVLSTRWKNLWISVCNLDFNDELWYFIDKESMIEKYLNKKWAFFNLVDKVLLLNVVANINKFSLSCRESDTRRFSKWISSIVGRNVQELHLSGTKRHPYKLPSCILTCESLTTLTIAMEASINIPSLIHFPHLKVLNLYNIVFSSDQLMREVSLNCPVLAEFVLSYCTWLKIKVVNISAPSLKMLKISDPLHDQQDCDIKIQAESIISLRLSSYNTYKHSLCCLSSLADAYIFVTRDTSVGHTISLLNAIINVKDMKLSSSSIENFALPYVLSKTLQFSRLTHLKVKRTLLAIAIIARELINLLSKMPNLESLCFYDGLGTFEFRGHGRIMGTTGRSFLSKLKLVEIRYFSWKESEIWFVKFLMKSARVIDKLTVRLTRCQERRGFAERKERLTKELEMLAEKSNCVLQIDRVHRMV